MSAPIIAVWDDIEKCINNLFTEIKMKEPIKYTLTIWDESVNTELLHWESENPFPRLENGDFIDAGGMVPHSDTGSVLMVVSSELLFVGDGNSREIVVSVGTRLLTRYEKKRAKQIRFLIA